VPVPASNQKFERAPGSDINQPSESEGNKISQARQNTVYKSSIGTNSELNTEIAAYRRMIEKEQEEIKQLKAQISKKGESMSKTSTATVVGGATTSGAALANQTWEDNAASSGKKFKFIHVILVSILFLFLGSYLAKVPLPTDPAQTDATAATGSPTETSSASAEKVTDSTTD